MNGEPKDRTEGLTIRDLVMEVRTSVDRLHTDLNEFKGKVVLRSEYEKDNDLRKTVRRYLVTTVTAMVGVGTACVVAVVNFLS